MKTLITLGSQFSYSDLASKKINESLKLETTIFFEPSIDGAFKALKDHDYLVLPIENAIDGYIQRTLDLLYKYDYHINHMIELPVDFSLISNETNLDDIETIYVQFKAKNQCLDFLEHLSNVHYIITDSNTESLNQFLKHKKHSAAIIPKHLINDHYLLSIHNIHDQLLNHTRFALIERKVFVYNTNKQNKALISLLPKKDEVGLLYNLLSHFKKLNINLSSIISRPRIEKQSPYHFFLEIEIKEDNLNQLIKTLENENQLAIKILGVY